MAPKKQADRPKQKAREKQMGRPKQKARAKLKDRLRKEARAQRPVRSHLVKRPVKRKGVRRSGTAPTATISLWRMRALEAERNVIDLLGQIKQKDETLVEVMAQYKVQQIQSLMLNDQLTVERHANIRTIVKAMRQNQVKDDVEQNRLGSDDVF